MNMELQKLTTEQRNPASMHIDEMATLEMVRVINEEDKKVAAAIEAELPAVARAVDAAAERFGNGGRLIYCGSGTSGRLGTLDSVELLPTYGISPERAFGLIAGKREAMYYAVEGAEDSSQMAVDDLKEVHLSAGDVLISIAASGRTPYGIGAIEYAKEVGALTISVICNRECPMYELADIAIAPVVGPEVITGSTRMKAGTAQKMVLNMLSTSIMIKCGKVYQNLMVHVQPSNEKLVHRARTMISQVTGVDMEAAAKLLDDAGRDVSVAIIMHETELDREKAAALLEQASGRVSQAIRCFREGAIV